MSRFAMGRAARLSAAFPILVVGLIARPVVATTVIVVCDLSCCALCPEPSYQVAYPYSGPIEPDPPMMIYGDGETERSGRGVGNDLLSGPGEVVDLGRLAGQLPATSSHLQVDAPENSASSSCPFGHIVSCRLPTQPPGHVVIDCVPSSSGSHFCQVYPLGNLSYSWSTTGPLHTTVPPAHAGSSQEIWCSGASGGQLTLSVTSPYGLSSNASVQLSCHGM